MITTRLVPPATVEVTIERSHPETDVIALGYTLVHSLYGNLNWRFDVSEGNTYVYTALE